jgi:cytochrome c-type biogenesis protein CcmH
VRLIAVLLAWCLPLLAAAQSAQPTPEDPVTNQRAVHLAEQLRCLVCQNQSLADSHADLAVDLRRQIREQVAAGKSDVAIIDYMVERYGDFVRYRPPVKASTLLLWFGPPVLMVFGLFLLMRYLGQRRIRIENAPLTEAERNEARTLLGEPAPGRRT